MKNLLKKISKTLKDLRSHRSWSLDAASEKTGVSKAMLGQIERGESSPTISTLWKIAKGFDVSFSSLTENLESSKYKFLRSKKVSTKNYQGDKKIKLSTIFPYNKESGFEVFAITLLPTCHHKSAPHRKGIIEYVIVASGEIEILINDKWHSIKESEGIRFAADKPHGYRNVSKKIAIFHNIICYNEK